MTASDSSIRDWLFLAPISQYVHLLLNETELYSDWFCWTQPTVCADRQICIWLDTVMLPLNCAIFSPKDGMLCIFWIVDAGWNGRGVWNRCAPHLGMVLALPSAFMQTVSCLTTDHGESLRSFSIQVHFVHIQLFSSVKNVESIIRLAVTAVTHTTCPSSLPLSATIFQVMATSDHVCVLFRHWHR